MQKIVTVRPDEEEIIKQLMRTALKSTGLKETLAHEKLIVVLANIIFGEEEKFVEDFARRARKHQLAAKDDDPVFAQVLTQNFFQRISKEAEEERKRDKLVGIG